MIKNGINVIKTTTKTFGNIFRKIGLVARVCGFEFFFLFLTMTIKTLAITVGKDFVYFIL